MSFTSSDRLNPNDPLYYAPPRLRRGADFPSTPGPETSSDRLRPTSPASRFDALLEQAVAQSLAVPRDAEMASEPPAFAFERDHERGSFGLGARFAAAIAASAAVALLFVVLVPMLQRSDPPKLAAGEYQTILALATTAQANATPDESQALLQKFLQWQQRDGADQQPAR